MKRITVIAILITGKSFATIRRWTKNWPSCLARFQKRAMIKTFIWTWARIPLPAATMKYQLFPQFSFLFSFLQEVVYVLLQELLQWYFTQRIILLILNCFQLSNRTSFNDQSSGQPTALDTRNETSIDSLLYLFQIKFRHIYLCIIPINPIYLIALEPALNIFQYNRLASFSFLKSVKTWIGVSNLLVNLMYLANSTSAC